MNKQEKHKHIWKPHEYTNKEVCLICGKFKYSKIKK